MISLKMELVERGLTPKQLKEQLPAIKEPAWRRLGEHFHEVNLPRRFTWAGGRMLNYAPRTQKYTKRKQKLKKHYDPLRWSDVSRSLALSIQDIRTRVTITRSEVRIVIRARGLNRRAKGSQIRMSEEVRRIADREFNPLIRVLSNEVDVQMKKRDLR